MWSSSLPLSLLCFCFIFARGSFSTASEDFNKECTLSKSSSSIQDADPLLSLRPNIDGSYTFYGGEIKRWNGTTSPVKSPILDSSNNGIEIGRIASMNSEQAKMALQSGRDAWDSGNGVWPQMSPFERITAMENFVRNLSEKRNDIIQVLMWEICKNSNDAAVEFDRTIVFIRDSIKAYKDSLQSSESWRTVGGILHKIRRTAIGLLMCLGPFNYPFNETYAVLIPALLTGNIILLKIPTLGGLAHMLTLQAFASSLPKGTVNFISGSGRETMGPIMASGEIDALAFIGGSKTADTLIKMHPNPHRLKLFLQLEGKNLGIVLPDANVDEAVDQIVIGSTTFNGQRCTAIKLVMVHRSIVDSFLPKFISKIASLKAGLPWEQDVSITPLPEPNKISFLQSLIDDAVTKGASLVNQHLGGGSFSGNLMKPAIVYPITDGMRLWTEEQFGPVIPIGVFDDVSEIYSYYQKSIYGQQAAIFTSSSQPQSEPHLNLNAASKLLDFLSTSVGRININTQCGRSPDALPFSGRRSSALGTMSVSEALNAFSIETVVAAKANEKNSMILEEIGRLSKFLASD